jgi:ATP-binding protein involved in chromosome partitioning
MIIVTILSGKGGVGKTTTVVGLALALQVLGYRAAILDLDLENPSIAGRDGVTGLTRRDLAFPGEKIVPPTWCGIPVMSLSLMPLDEFEDTPTMVDEETKHQIIRQLYREVDWGDAQVLVVDMPPGSGEEVRGLLTLGPDGAVVVTAPQSISEAAVRKVMTMGEEYSIRVLGLVQNCVNLVDGEAGRRLSEAFGVPLLASLPWDEEIPEAMERHQPFDSDLFLPVARQVVETFLEPPETPSWRAAPAAPSQEELVEEGPAGVAPRSAPAIFIGDPPDAGPPAEPKPDADAPDPTPAPWTVFREMTDQEWEEMKAVLPPHHRGGRQRFDDRALLNGILWVFTTRGYWADMPARYGNHWTARMRMRRWREDGLWEPIWRKAKELGYALTEGEFESFDDQDFAEGILHHGNGAGQQARAGAPGGAEVPGGGPPERAAGGPEPPPPAGEGPSRLAEGVR